MRTRLKNIAQARHAYSRGFSHIIPFSFQFQLRAQPFALDLACESRQVELPSSSSHSNRPGVSAEDLVTASLKQSYTEKSVVDKRSHLE